MVGSTKPPLMIRAKVRSKTSTLPRPKLAAYSRAVVPVPARASPVYEEVGNSFTTRTAFVPAAPFHPEIVPVALANRKFALWPLARTNVFGPAELNT
jgi:hypothetical protein